jgi:hypothetical protein
MDVKYDGEPVNGSQIDIKRKTCDIRTWKKHLFLDISSTNIDTLVPSLYQCVRHLLRLSNVLERISRPSREPLYATNTSNREQEIFLYGYTLHRVFAHKESTTEFCSSVVYTSSAVAILTTETIHWTCACASANLDCHEAGLCCYLVIHIENLLCPLQLYYFHLWPVYWLSLVGW